MRRIVVARQEMPIELFHFRFVDPVSGKWKRARYVATREEIAKRHAEGEWEIIGPPEVRGDEPVRMFAMDQQGTTFAASARIHDEAPQLEPSISDAERFILCIFLRRYVTWCARRRRFAAMQGAAELHRQVCI